jgi:hypothetical protein
MFGFILHILPTLSVVVIGFACGYALRDWRSRRRRAVEREKILPETSGASRELTRVGVPPLMQASKPVIKSCAWA